MKVLLWAIAPVGAAVLIAPLATKPYANNLLENNLVEFERQATNIGITLERQSESSEFLSSSYITRVGFSEEIQGDNEDLCFDLETVVSHSPTDILRGNFASTSTTVLPLSKQDESCGVKTLFESSPELLSFYEKNYSNNTPIRIDADFGLFGSTTASFEISEFKLDIPKDSNGQEHVSISSEAMVTDLQLENSLQSYTYQMEWGGLDALVEESSGPIKFRISGMTGEGEQHLAYKNIWLGHVNQKLSNVSISQISDVGIKKYSLPSLVLNSNAYEDSNGIQSRFKMTAENINENLGDFELDFSLSNLDPDAMTQITEILDSVDMSDDSQQAQLVAKKDALFHYAKIILQKAILRINGVKYSMDNQELLVNGALKAPGIEQLDIDAVMMNPMSLLTAIEFNLNGKIDKGLSEVLSEPIALAMSDNPSLSGDELEATKGVMKSMMDSQLDAGMAMGFLVDNGNSFNTSVKLENGMPMINGQPMQLPTAPSQ